MCSAIRICLSVLLFCAPGALAFADPEPAPQTSSLATVPVEELLRLYRLEEDSRKRADAAPLVASTIHRIDMLGRLLDDGIDVSARFEIAVLPTDKWERLPLLRLGASTEVSRLPSVANAAFATEGDTLYFLTKKAGTHEFKIQLFERAERENARRKASLDPGAAIVATLGLEYDEDLFRLESEAVDDKGRRRILRKPGGFSVAWQARQTPKAKTLAARPAVESTIPHAYASMVSTLEGRRITRIKYRLRFAGRKSISFELPEQQELAHTFLNGVAIPAKAQGRDLTIDVAPTRAGDQTAQLELVLVSETDIGFHLSGALSFELPSVSWPTNELWLQTHLPGVFDYEWSGGSLAPASKPPSVSFTHKVPEPGRTLSFHQYLVSSGAPHMMLDYEVNLDGHYFKP
ncbi:MAG: hypothetical protein GY725_01655 [bacterium]|nr:hypothetical protein [bacterium]